MVSDKVKEVLVQMQVQLDRIEQTVQRIEANKSGDINEKLKSMEYGINLRECETQILNDRLFKIEVAVEKLNRQTQ